jgi:hypothetical protein
MPSIAVLQPLDQPFGNQRALSWVRDGLGSDNFTRLRIAVAYVKEGELLRLRGDLAAFRARGGVVEAVLGFDQRGTSRQALRFALQNFNQVRLWQHPSLLVTFHPKMYLFDGPQHAQLHVGSCNLTVGGLETNCESAVRLSYDLPAEQQAWDAASSGWAPLVGHPNSRQLDEALIVALEAADLVFDEAATLEPSVGALVPKGTPQTGAPLFPSTPIVFPSARPRSWVARAGHGVAAVADAPVAVASSLAQALLIQIVPHHNGEIFLSKTAVDQHPSFFGYPFSGWTTPKTGNAPYPQRVPDPRTDWTVYGPNGEVAVSVANYPLNTVFYSTKSEIRITVNPALREAIAEYSILQITRADESTSIDYVCEVYPPDSPQYAGLLAACNQTMPSGGKAKARRFGWV